MWQKLNRLDVIKLQKARIQIINVLQLLIAPFRSMNNIADNSLRLWPKWDKKSSSFRSNKFGENQEITVSLDIDKFILSIHGANQYKEHLVLSGMTYPMAYGWMNIKLERFQFDCSQFNDQTPYELESYLKPDVELSLDDQFTYDQIIIYYNNASFLLKHLKDKLQIDAKVLIDPATANMILISSSSQESPRMGFSLGSKAFPEPYFFLIPNIKPDIKIEEFDGIWNSSESQIVMMASDFLNQDQDLEYRKLVDFFMNNIAKIPKTG